jgi:excisionase family DNA binding protein
LAELLQVTVRTVENWQRRGVLQYVKVGKVVRFVWGDVLEALRSFKVSRRTMIK